MKRNAWRALVIDICPLIEFLAWTGLFVSTVGRDETAIREYIRKQEQEDKRLDQMNLWR